jgi:hypothetical protein
MGRDFLGAYDMLRDRLEIMDRADRNRVAETIQIKGLDDPEIESTSPPTSSESCARRWRWPAASCPPSTASRSSKAT